MVLLTTVQSAKRGSDVDALILTDGITDEVWRRIAFLLEQVESPRHLLIQGLTDWIRRRFLSDGKMGENRNRYRRQDAESLHHITFLDKNVRNSTLRREASNTGMFVKACNPTRR